MAGRIGPLEERAVVELAAVDGRVVAGYVAHAALGQKVVAALHLRHRP